MPATVSHIDDSPMDHPQMGVAGTHPPAALQGSAYLIVDTQVPVSLIREVSISFSGKIGILEVSKSSIWLTHMSTKFEVVSLPQPSDLAFLSPTASLLPLSFTEDREGDGQMSQGVISPYSAQPSSHHSHGTPPQIDPMSNPPLQLLLAKMEAMQSQIINFQVTVVQQKDHLARCKRACCRCAQWQLSILAPPPTFLNVQDFAVWYIVSSFSDEEASVVLA